MRRVKSTLLTIVVVLLATQVVIAAGSKTKSIDFWFVKKGSVDVPPSWCSLYQEFYDDPCLGSYMMSGHTVIRPSNPEGKIQGIVQITAIDIQDDSDVSGALRDIPNNWRESHERSYAKKFTFDVSNIKVGRVSGSTYAAKRYRINFGDHFSDLIVCRGQKTKYRKGIRYAGQDVTPIYAIEVEWPSGKQQGSKDIKAILKSLKLP